MQHEQQTLVAVTAARGGSMNAASIGQKAQADLTMTVALRGLFAVAEKYPQLKANENFLKLQKRISELEERIADRREYFNDDVNTYNTRLRQFPEVFLATVLRLKPREMFKASEADSKPPVRHLQDRAAPQIDCTGTISRSSTSPTSFCTNGSAYCTPASRP